MFRTTRVFEILVTCLCVFAIVVGARTPRNDKRPVLPVPLQSQPESPPSLISTALDAFVLAEFDFEGAGGPDSQGWSSVDNTAQKGVYWQVAGNMMWCGVNSGAPEFCHYATLPGYGHSWYQIFQSTDFSTTGNVTLDFDARYDSESGYDFTIVEYRSATGHWNDLAGRLWGYSSTQSYSYVIPEDSLNNSVRFRFVFESDDVWDDEDGNFNTDGAIFLDDIQVSDGSGLVDTQDFEFEVPGDTATADGHWYATIPEAYGDFADLFDGNTVLQEDPLVTNSSHLWGFFNGSTYDYACGGHPEQLVVPYKRTTDRGDIYLSNTIHSPWISLAPIAARLASGGNLYLEFDVYGDIPLDNLVIYQWHVRSLVGGCARRWSINRYPQYWEEATWKTDRIDISTYILPGATDIQVGLRIVDGQILEGKRSP